MFFLLFFHFKTIPVVKNPQYIVSQKGKFNLIHNNFKYICIERVENANRGFGNKIRWRCSYTSNFRYVCRARARTSIVDGVEQAEFIGEHEHDAPLQMNVPKKSKQ